MRTNVDARRDTMRIPLKPVDLAGLDQQLPKLIDCYRGALKKVEQLPRIGRVKTVIVGKVIDGKHESVRRQRPSRRWVIRSIVRLFVETHVRAKLDAIARSLRIESMAIRSDSDKRTKKIRMYVGWLKESMESLFSWSRLRTTVSKAPFLSTILALAAAVVARLTGTDLSSTQALAESTSEAGNSSDWAVFLDLIKLFGVVVLYAYVLVVPIIVQLGFRVKRAIFQGGTTIPDLFEWRAPWGRKEKTEMVDEERWDQFPETNIYKKENQFFALLGVRKPTAFPLDFVMNVKVYFVFFLAVDLGVGAIQVLTNGGTLKALDYGGILLWFLFAMYLVSGIHHYRVRKNAENM